MVVNGKEDNAQKDQTEASQHEIVSKNDAKVCEENGKIDDGKNINDTNDKEKNGKSENDDNLLPLSDGNEKENMNGEDSLHLSNSSEEEKMKKNETTEEFSLTDHEKKALHELRSKLEDAILSNKLFDNVENYDEVDKNISLWGVHLLPSNANKGTNTLLIKFLKARDFKPNDALEMLKHTLEWRKANKIDSILDEDLGDLDYDSMAFVKGLDREGHPICYNVYGVFANEEIYDKTFGSENSSERFLRWRIKLLENEILKLDFRAGGISTLLQINDLKNAPGPSRRDIRLATKKALGIFQDNYPEFIARNIFINVPFWFYAFNALLSPFSTQRAKNKFVFSRPARVTETLLKYITAEEIPVACGGLRRENDPDFSTRDAAFEINVKAGAVETIEIPTIEAGNNMIWDLTIIGWDVNYKEEFVPTNEGSYTVIVKKSSKISWQQEPIRNSFINKEPGKIVITIENSLFQKKKVLYRFKTNNNHPVS